MERLVAFGRSGGAIWRGRVIETRPEEGILLVQSLEDNGETIWLEEAGILAEMTMATTTDQASSPVTVTEAFPASVPGCLSVKQNIPTKATGKVASNSQPCTETSGPCNVCQVPSETRCARCSSVFYCSKEHQKEDWKHHRAMCFHVTESKASPAAALKGMMLEGQGGEMLGTFRWGPDHSFQLLPPMPLELSPVYRAVRGWQQYFATRFPSPQQSQIIAAMSAQFGSEALHTPPGPDTSEQSKLVLQPSLIDGLSFPMSLLFALRSVNWSLPNGRVVTFVIIGASFKAEQAIAMRTNYFEELGYAYPLLGGIDLVFVGPEVDGPTSDVKELSYAPPPPVRAAFFKGTTQEFLEAHGHVFNIGDTIFVGFNTGLGSGNVPLMTSLVAGVSEVITAGYMCVFSCANDHQDVRGETVVMKTILGPTFLLEPVKSPFAACSTFHAPGARETDWTCANSFVYVVKGYPGKRTEPLLRTFSSKGLRTAILAVGKREGLHWQ